MNCQENICEYVINSKHIPATKITSQSFKVTDNAGKVFFKSLIKILGFAENFFSERFAVYNNPNNLYIQSQSS